MTVGAREFQPRTSVRSGGAGRGATTRMAASSGSAGSSARRTVSSSALIAMTSSSGPMTVSIGGLRRGVPPAGRSPIRVESSNASRASPKVRPASSGRREK